MCMMFFSIFKSTDAWIVPFKKNPCHWKTLLLVKKAFGSLQPDTTKTEDITCSGRVQGSQAYSWMQTVLFLRQRLFCAAPGRHLCTKFAAALRITVRSRTMRMRKDMPRRWWYGSKMAPTDVGHSLLEQEDRRVSEVASTFAQGLPVVFKLGQSHFSYVLGNTCELDNWDVYATVLHGNGVEFEAYVPPPHRNVCEWMELVAASWQEATFMFISRSRRTEVAVHCKCHFAVDMNGLQLHSRPAVWISAWSVHCMATFVSDWGVAVRTGCWQVCPPLVPRCVESISPRWPCLAAEQTCLFGPPRAFTEVDEELSTGSLSAMPLNAQCHPVRQSPLVCFRDLSLESCCLFCNSVICLHQYRALLLGYRWLPRLSFCVLCFVVMMMMMMMMMSDKKTRKPYTKGDKETNCRQKKIENKFDQGNDVLIEQRHTMHGTQYMNWNLELWHHQ